MARVELEKIAKRYPGAHDYALEELTLDIPHGEFFVLLGPSGCGKSTALRMIAGLESISSGTLRIGGETMNRVPAKDRDIAMVFQSYALYPHMTVAKNLGFGLRRRAVPKDEIAKRVGEAAAMLELTELLDRKPHSLSGGQRQRVALGRAIVRDPEVFLFDEPLSNLDAALRLSTRNELIKLHQRIGTTMIYVTHDQVEAMTMGQRICIMNKGRLAQVGTPLEVYRNPADTFVAKFLGNPPMNLLEVPVRVENDTIVIDVGGKSIAVPGLSTAAVAGKVGSRVVFGIRPEDIYERSRDVPGGRGVSLRARVGTVETLGAETLLDLELDGAANTFCGRVGRESKAVTGDTVDIHLDADAIHLFDPETTRAIAAPSRQ
ncbi:MAG: ABC transporter ATP-binding protein [Flavobacteriaceae bacterium]